LATLKELADLLQGTVVGNPKLNIQGVSTIKDGKPGTITFMVHQKYFKYVESTQASAVIASDSAILNGLDGIIVNNPKLAMVKILDYFSPQYPLKKGIHKTAIIDPDTVLGKGVSIGPYTIIDRGVIIGDNTVIGANNVINADTVIGCDSKIENNKILNDGELLLIDAGCESLGYASDITRTFPINGRFSKVQKQIYQIVLSAQKSAIASIKPGEKVNTPHEIACNIISRELNKLGIMKELNNLSEFYMHKTGHWLGLDVHDVGEYEIDNDFRDFEEGMVTTVEPGIYIRKNDKID